MFRRHAFGDVGGGRCERLEVPHDTHEAPAQRLLAAARSARAPVALSRNAGRYLCNYLCWRATEAAQASGGPAIAAQMDRPHGVCVDSAGLIYIGDLVKWVIHAQRSALSQLEAYVAGGYPG